MFVCDVSDIKIYEKFSCEQVDCFVMNVTDSSGHRLIWWGGGMRHRFATNPMLHRTILRKSNFRIRTFTTKQV